MANIQQQIRDEKRQEEINAMDPDPRLVDALTDLEYTVNNINKMPKLAMRGNVYQALNLSQIMSTHYDGWWFGYKLEDVAKHIIKKRIWIKAPQPLEEIPLKDFNTMLASVFEAMIEPGQHLPRVQQGKQGVYIEQSCMIMVLVERNPNLITPNFVKVQ